MKKYRYYCRMRPPAPGAVPFELGALCKVFDERQYVPEIDCMAWGWVEYDHPLSPKEVADYELLSAPREVE